MKLRKLVAFREFKHYKTWLKNNMPIDHDVWAEVLSGIYYAVIPSKKNAALELEQRERIKKYGKDYNE